MLRRYLLLSCLALANMASADAPAFTSVQGRLSNSAGQAVTDGKYAMVVSLYDAEVAGAPLWKETFVAIEVVDGVFTVAIGAAASPLLDATIFSGPRWVGVAVAGEPELPRFALGHVPFAFRATLATAAQTASVAADLACSGCVGGAELTPGAVGTAALADKAVTPEKLADSVWAALDGTYLGKAGGVVTGNLTIQGLVTTAGSADFASVPLEGFRFENANSPPVPCDAAHTGYAYFDTVELAVIVCNGTNFRRLSLSLPGETAQSAAASCLAIQQANAAAGDKDYWIDIDGPGGSPPTLRFCDMTGGGWTRVLADDFSNGAAGWSMTTTTTCGPLGVILGGYNVTSGTSFGTTVSLGTAAHTQVRVTLDYVAIDSSDGETGYVRLDGTQLWTQTLANCSNGVTTQYCGTAPPCHGDTLYKVSVTAAHNTGTLSVLAGSTLDQAANDESFGIDNVVVWFR